MTGEIERSVIAPLPETEAAVGKWRAAHDPWAGLGVEAHVTVLKPFVELDAAGAAAFAEAVEGLDHGGWGLPVVRREHQIGTGDGYRGRHAAHTPFAAARWSTTASDRPFVATGRHGRSSYGRGSPL